MIIIRVIRQLHTAAVQVNTNSHIFDCGELLYSTNWKYDLKTEKHFVLSDFITNSDYIS